MRKSSRTSDVDVELTLLMFKRLAWTVGLGCIGLVVASTLTARHINTPRMWLLAKFAFWACTFRFCVTAGFSFRSKKVLTLAAAARWNALFSVSTLLFFLVVSLITFNYFNDSGNAAMLCTVGTLTTCAGLNARLSMRPWLLRCCGPLTMGTLAFCMFRSGDVMLRVAGAMVLIFAASFWESAALKFENLVEQLRASRKLSESAEQDVLTGLANRRSLCKVLDRACLQQIPLAILFIDLDRFKPVNDTFGHAAGDTLLQQVATRLSSMIRASDLVARMGGDEFVILQSPVPTKQFAEDLAQRVVHEMALPFLIAGQSVTIGASVGVRLSTISERDATALLNEADNALYRVKQAGRGGFLLA